MKYLIAFAQWLLELAGVREAGQEEVTEYPDFKSGDAL